MNNSSSLTYNKYLSADTFRETTLILNDGVTALTELTFMKESLCPLTPSDPSLEGFRQLNILAPIVDSSSGQVSDVMAISVEVTRMFDNSVRPAR
jgi:hypothetical protein